MNASVDFTSKHRLKIPAEGHAPMLFMEWLSNNKKRKFSFTIMRKVRQEVPVFLIYLPYQDLKTYNDIKEYINANL